MHSLSETLTGFSAALGNPDQPTPAAIATTKGCPAKQRFNVYRNNVAVTMIEALRSTFPAVDRLVGADFFSATVRVYLDKEPPRSPLLFRYGATFGAFLDGFPPAASVPYLGDVARLEWARLQAYHAADAKAVSIEVLGEVPPDLVGKTRFTLHPSLSLIRSPWPVVSLWAASTDRGTADQVDMNNAEQAVIIRPFLEVDTRRLPEGGFYFIDALVEGLTLEDAARQAAAKDEAFDLATYLQGLFDLGVVAGILSDHHQAEG